MSEKPGSNRLPSRYGQGFSLPSGSSPGMRDYIEEAERCRRQALAYVGQPEASFLLKIADEFERLSFGSWRGVRRRRHPIS